MDLGTITFINDAVNHTVKLCPAYYRGHTCGRGFAPELVGGCKQYAAVKLRELLLAGAQPNEFVIWVTQAPGREYQHLVLVHTPSGLVLDNLINLVEPRALKERYEGYVFLRPCVTCGEPAEEEAARIKAARFAREGF